MKENEFSSIATDIKKPESATTEKDPDSILYERGILRHRLTKQKLDSWFQDLIHPFVLITIGFVYLLAFLAMRYASLFTSCILVHAVYADMKSAGSYLATAIISCIITEFIQNLRKK